MNWSSSVAAPSIRPRRSESTVVQLVGSSAYTDRIACTSSPSSVLSQLLGMVPAGLARLLLAALGGALLERLRERRLLRISTSGTSVLRPCEREAEVDAVRGGLAHGRLGLPVRRDGDVRARLEVLVGRGRRAARGTGRAPRSAARGGRRRPSGTRAGSGPGCRRGQEWSWFIRARSGVDAFAGHGLPDVEHGQARVREVGPLVDRPHVVGLDVVDELLARCSSTFSFGWSEMNGNSVVEGAFAARFANAAM